MQTSLQLVAEQLQLAPTNNLYEKVKAAVNDLMLHDMDRLISILYRMDVSEAKIKSALEQNVGKDAAELIVGLMIERLDQKQKSRQQFNNRDNDISEEERW